MMNYTESVELVDKNLLTLALEQSKAQTSQITIIPRFIYSQPIYGINERTIVVESRYQIFDEQRHLGTTLWQSPYLDYIAFYSKDVAPFLRVASMVDKLYIRYHTYVVNGANTAIAVQLFSDQEVTVTVGGEKVNTIPNMPLIPFRMELDHVTNIISKWSYSKLLPETANGIDLNEVEQFNELYDGLASQGAKAIAPSNSLIQYTMYLSKTMFSFAKKDKVTLYIATDVPGEFPFTFMALFDIKKVKKSKMSNHKYYMLGYKMV